MSSSRDIAEAATVLELVADEFVSFEPERAVAERQRVASLVNAAEDAIQRHDYAAAVSLLEAEHLTARSCPKLTL